MVDKIKQWAEVAKTVGMPWAMAIALLAVVVWQAHCHSQMQSQMLTVIERNTAAIEAQTTATEALRDEVRRER